jgi:hypothetical protein
LGTAINPDGHLIVAVPKGASAFLSVVNKMNEKINFADIIKQRQKQNEENTEKEKTPLLEHDGNRDDSGIVDGGNVASGGTATASDIGRNIPTGDNARAAETVGRDELDILTYDESLAVAYLKRIITTAKYPTGVIYLIEHHGYIKDFKKMANTHFYNLKQIQEVKLDKGNLKKVMEGIRVLIYVAENVKDTEKERRV